ncbi:MAG TPA: DUF2958 domain-containing protein [Anaerolineaceae bacterium]
MSHEVLQPPAPKRPEEQFGFNENERLFWRVSDQRFHSILSDEKTIIHKVHESSNMFGEFLFVTTSRPGEQERIAMTFYGLGYHDERERWITQEWFWYQTDSTSKMLEDQMNKEEATEILKKRSERIQTYTQEDTQTQRGKIFEILADLTDDDGAMAEMEDLESLDAWIIEIDGHVPPEEPSPTGENLLDEASREKLPALYSQEEKGLDALAQVKFFTLDSNWTWYASEFDGEDIFFGLVSGFEVEYGYFSLKELQEARGPMGLEIERDVHFEPQSLKELAEWHRQQHQE